MVEAVLWVCLGLRCRGMDLAPKSLIMSSSWQVAIRIQARLADLGILVKAARQGQDLGVDISCGRKRMVHKHRKRALAASFKHGRLRSLKFLGTTHSSRVKASLWRQSVRAQNSYAEPVVGQSLASIEQQRRALGHSLDKGKRGRCLTSLVACLEGPGKEPLFCFLKRCILGFFRAIQATFDLFVVVKRAWSKIVLAIRDTPPKNRLSRCWGPVSTLIIGMGHIKWQLVSPVCWVDPRGGIWALGDGPCFQGDFTALLDAVAADVQLLYWARASLGRHGLGIASGVCCDSLKRQLNRLQGKGEFRQRAALLAFSCAGVWTADRKKEAGLAEVNTCPRCGQAAETDFHMLYECPSNDLLEPCAATRQLAVEAKIGAQECPAFWLRGLIPLDWLPVASLGVQDFFNQHGLVENCFEPAGYRPGWVLIFGDCGGGPNAASKRLRVLGASLVQMDLSNLRQIAWLDFLVPGRQEVGRGELFAFIVALERSTCHITYVADRKSVWQIWQQKAWLSPESRQNCDLLFEGLLPIWTLARGASLSCWLRATAHKRRWRQATPPWP